MFGESYFYSWSGIILNVLLGISILYVIPLMPVVKKIKRKDTLFDKFVDNISMLHRIFLKLPNWIQALSGIAYFALMITLLIILDK